MTSTPPSKRQRRSEYRKTQEQQIQSGEVHMPQKRLYRQRAHANPFSDHRLSYPISPAHMDWSTHFPAFVDPNPDNVNLSGARRLTKEVEIADIGCGFGGLLVALAPLMPDTLMVGMELRAQVLDYVTDRIRALRAQRPAPPLPSSDTRSSTPPAAQLPPASSPTSPPAASPPPSQPQSLAPAPSSSPSAHANYQNISALRTNTMKFLPNFFAHRQLSAIFICFPDPHFKTRKHKARIVSSSLNAEYAYVLRPGGKLYTITDVEELHRWIVGHFEGVDDEEGDGQEGGINTVKELFERVGNQELDQDPCVKVMMEETEEGKKVTRNKGKKFVAVWRRKEDPQWPC
ncbi:tRNA (guanine-N(7)-)-methyltransferase [Emergomyces pasteurianus Ep9510]|uniref:tRNA (guanine-N(7)-)-methyltransferase n=1 Tax=Emergomyces pasteurianus Ep9510 TaxID=1447872 RepID=A0A1J9P692_9EURO|nr:tRNA (guanine-N(7)-)-methyltransferase [Emergomyces pasteurianus Ep9510]